MIKYDSLGDIIKKAVLNNLSISQIAITDQAKALDCDEKDLYREMQKNLIVMKKAIIRGIENKNTSYSGLSGLNASLFDSHIKSKKSICGSILGKVILYSLAISEQNACMGKIVAAPTAGSCGVIPAVILAVSEENSIPEHAQVMSLFTAGAVGMVIAENASVSGAKSGCQAECGAAAAMAAASCIELFKGSAETAGHACAIALKNMLGLVCDPVAGLVEVPCVKRNAIAASIAISSADMALAGIKSIIPADEVIIAMKSIGDMLPSSLKETSKAGLAMTPTGKRIAERLIAEDDINP